MTSVCLAVSSFQDDESVLRLLEAVEADARRSVLREVIVIDSLGTGRVPDEARRRGWDWLVYESSDTNLGSAGNLARRLELAAARGHDYVLALNHDGVLDFAVLDKLIAFASSEPRLGAAYPLRYMSNRPGYDLTGAQRFAFPAYFPSASPAPGSSVAVKWSSSNGALYSLEPIRSGLIPWADLWMGWEDLGYGWLLYQSGYTQFIVVDALCSDNYEYTTERVAGLPLRVSDKPAWYAYYHARNIILVTRRCEKSLPHAVVAAARIAQELLITTFVRNNKVDRFRFIAEGVRDGISGRGGKGRAP